jgi:hypothetical protein
MDQLRVIMRVIWQQRFWVLIVLAPLIAVVCWSMASGKLQAAFSANKSTIDGHFTSMSSITNEPVHGNDDVNAKEREEAVKISKSVRSLWKRLYDSQREQVLSWPAVLGEDFIEEIDKKKFLDRISPSARRRYLDYINNRFDALVEIVDAKKLELGPGGGGMMPGMGLEGGGFNPGMEIGATGPGVEKDYLVDWLDQGELRQELDFGGSTPSYQKVWVTQENLWVYETLLNVIKNTNTARGATRAAENAAIRVIMNLDVGQEAADAMNEKGNIIMPAAAAGGEITGEVEPGDMGGVMEYNPLAGEMGDPAQADAQLLNRRYVDQTGAPITDVAADATASLGVEYRRLPVRMSLLMDQRWIPRVLVECANASLPIEVQRLRINPDLSGAGFESALSAGGGLEGGGMRQFAGGNPMGFGQSMPTDLSKDFVTVEIQGLVYIYNEPNDAVLTVPGAEEAAPPADGAPSTEVALQ